MDPVRRLLLLLLLASVASPAGVRADAGAEGEVIDQVVATIAPGGGRGLRTLITRSDLELEARVVLVSRGGILAADQPLPEETLAAVLDWLVSEHLLMAEAEQLEVAAVDPALVEKELAAFRARFEGEEAWGRFLRNLEVGEADLARIFRRRLAVDGYVASRLRLATSITEAEVRRAWEARRASFGDSSYEWVRPRLRAQLERERRESLVAAITADLRSRAEVRLLVRLNGERRAAPEPGKRPWYLAPEEAQP